MALEDCAKEISKASGGEYTEKDAKQLLVDIEKKVNEARAQGYNVKYADLLEEQKIGFMKAEKNRLFAERSAIDNQIKLDLNIKAIKEISDNPKEGIEAFTRQVSERIKTKTSEYEGTLKGFLEEEKVTDFFDERSQSQSVAKYRGLLTDVDDAGTPIIRKGGLPKEMIPPEDLMAYRTAYAIAKFDDLMRIIGEDLGAPIGFLKGRQGRNSFNPLMLVGDRIEAFKQRALTDFDWDKMFIGDATREEFVDKLARKINEGIHGEIFDDYSEQVLKEVSGGSGIGADLAKKLGKNRTIHIKDDLWHQFMSDFGYGDIYSMVDRDVKNYSRAHSMIESLGTNPRASWDNILGVLKRTTPGFGKEGKHILDSMDVRAFYDYLSGNIDSPESYGISRFFATQRMFGVALKLGSSLFTSLTDPATRAMRTAAIASGNSIGDQVATFGDHFIHNWSQTLDFLGLNSVEEKAMINAQIAGLDDMTFDIVRDFQNSEIGNYAKNRRNITNFDKTVNFLDTAHEKVFKLNPVVWWTNKQIKASYASTSYLLGGVGDSSFKSLSKSFQGYLNESGIADIWDLVRTKVVKDANGKGFLPATALDDISLEELRKFKPDLSERELRNYQNSVKTQLKSAFRLEATKGLAMPDVVMKAKTFGLTSRGTIRGEVLRSLLQFKQYPISYVMNVLGPLWKSQKYGVLGAGLATSAVTQMTANWIKDVAAGKTPRNYGFDESNPRAMLNNWTSLFATVSGLPVLDEIAPKFIAGVTGDSERGLKSDDFLTLLGPGIGDTIKTITGGSQAIGALTKGDTDKAISKILPTVYNAPVLGPVLHGHILGKAVNNMLYANLMSVFRPDYEDDLDKFAKLQGSRYYDLATDFGSFAKDVANPGD